MPFAPIDLTKDGNIRYLLRRLARDARPFLSIIHVAFSGTYRDGSEGAPDAHYIRGIVSTTDEIWRPNGIILDLTELSYEWGDEMDCVLDPPSNAPFAIVVSSRCEPAISSLCCPGTQSKSVLDRDEFFDSFDLAFQYMRQQVVQDWNVRIAKVPEWGEKLDVSDLE